MASARTVTSSHPVGWLPASLVLAVLAGVLGMHGLVPGSLPVAAAGTGHHAVRAPASDVPRLDGGCSHSDGGAGHSDHADGTCAAAGTGSAYTPPAPAPAPSGAPAAVAPGNGLPASAVSGRGPPDLSELQLLRI
ncbi:DUF6153 family protein [Streptomyces sp. DH12]|uniref:DUF6153 family protein n=1 Tax=Streptomyces sp. DH12 TaxID=2857010 RepID=UPI001E46788D|nr:DUF6153 family protein [Streptomyces sp. DH12]